jgi:hypothetical protein
MIKTIQLSSAHGGYHRRLTINLPQLVDDIIVDAAIRHHGSHELLKGSQLGESCMVGAP